MIKTIFFDYDYTLGNREIAAYRTYEDILKNFSDIKDPVEFEAALQDCMIYDLRGETNKNFVKERLEKDSHVTLHIDDMNAYWNDHLWRYSVLYEDTLETLEQLKGKYHLAVITNGPSVYQRKKLEVTNITSYFEKIIVSGDYSFYKPDVRIFEIALKEMNAKKEESIMVGDMFGKDVIGAYRTGMKAVWMFAEGVRINQTEIPTIHALHELLPILDKYNEEN